MGGVCNPDLISLGSQKRGYKPDKCQKQNQRRARVWHSSHLALIWQHAIRGMPTSIHTVDLAHAALIHSHKRQSGNYVLKLTPMG